MERLQDLEPRHSNSFGAGGIFQTETGGQVGRSRCKLVSGGLTSGEWFR